MKYDIKVKETLFFGSKKKYDSFKKLNKDFAFIVSGFSILVNIFNFILPNLIVSLFCTFLVYCPHILEKKFEIIILEEFKFLITFHSMLHTIFGKILHFYDKYPLYDSILHILGGTLIALITFSITLSFELNYSKFSKKILKTKVNIDSLNFVNTIGVSWEIFEFTGDLLFSNVQGYRIAQENSLFDTMTDLIENNIGAILGILILWKIIKYNQNKGRNMEALFKSLTKEPPKLNQAIIN